MSTRFFLGTTYKTYGDHTTVKCYEQQVRDTVEKIHRKAMRIETRRPVHSFSVVYNTTEAVTKNLHNDLIKFKYVHFRPPFVDLRTGVKAFYIIDDEEIVKNAASRSYAWLYTAFMILVLVVVLQILSYEGIWPTWF
jgi:hypothetical protein